MPLTRTQTEQIAALMSLAQVLGTDFNAERASAYVRLFDGIGTDAIRTACHRLACEWRNGWFPRPAEIIEKARATEAGVVEHDTALEAWALAWNAVKRIDLEVDGSKDRHLGKLPPIVRTVLEGMGVANLTGGETPVSILQTEFVKHYRELAAKTAKVAALPDKVRERIESRQHSPTVARIVSSIGVGVGA